MAERDFSRAQILRFVMFNGDYMWAYRNKKFAYLFRVDDEVFLPTRAGEHVGFGVVNRTTLKRAYPAYFANKCLWENGVLDPAQCVAGSMLELAQSEIGILSSTLQQNGQIGSPLVADYDLVFQLYARTANFPRITDISTEPAGYLPSSKKYPSITLVPANSFGVPEANLTTDKDPHLWLNRVQIRASERFV